MMRTASRNRSEAKAAESCMSYGFAMTEIAMSSLATIFYRMPQFFQAGFGSLDAQIEVRRALVEKLAAASEIQFGTGVTLMQLGVESALGFARMPRFQAAALADAGLSPIHRRVHANAKRLRAAALRV